MRKNHNRDRRHERAMMRQPKSVQQQRMRYSMLQHSRKRAMERYGIFLSEYDYGRMCDSINAVRGFGEPPHQPLRVEYLRNLPRDAEAWLVELGGKELIAVWHDDLVMTFLLPEHRQMQDDETALDDEGLPEL